MKKIKGRGVNRDGLGRKGTRIDIEFKGGRWPKRYHITTHGKNEEQVAAELAALEVHHEAKVGRLDGFAGFALQTVVAATGEVVQLRCVTIREQGTDVELYVNVADSELKRVRGFPLSLVYPSVADVPDNDGIRQLVLERLELTLREDRENEAFLERVNALSRGV